MELWHLADSILANFTDKTVLSYRLVWCSLVVEILAVEILAICSQNYQNKIPAKFLAMQFA